MENIKEDINQLKEYRKKLSKLSEEEIKNRNLYLKKLADGTIQGPPTGFASIDKQWLSKYEKESIEALMNYKNIDISMYESLINYAKNHLNEVAFEYLGREYTYKELIENIDKTADSLLASNVKIDEIIPIILPNMPEARYLIYACSKIGAIPNPIMPTVSETDIETIIKNTKATKIFMMDGLNKKFSNIFDKYNITETYEINPLRSSGGIFSAIYKIKQIGKKSDYDEFIKSGKNYHSTIVPRKASDIAIIEQTGGTTALTTKSVKITNGNVYASSYQLENGGFNFVSGDSLLDILIPSISYGAAFEHLTLCNGIKNYMIPILVKEQIGKYITKFKPNHIMMGPIHFECICKDKKRGNWKFIKNIVSGGDSMSLNLEDESNTKLHEVKNANVNVEQGYGESECFGAAACNHNEFIKRGSVGIPHLLTNISIFKYDDTTDDYTTDIELPYLSQGEICISSPVVMNGYLNNSEATNLVLKKHSDGKIWLHTGDIGYIDNEGYLFITDRIKDLIFRNGFKVSPKKISKAVLEKCGDKLEDLVVIGMPDDTERNVPVLFYKLKGEYSNLNMEVLNIINEIYRKELSEIERPKDTIELNSIPRTAAGKIDKKLIKKQYLDNLLTSSTKSK